MTKGREIIKAYLQCSNLKDFPLTINTIATTKPIIINGFNAKNTSDIYNYLNQQKIMAQQVEYTLFRSYIEEIIKTVNNNYNKE